jgi:antitoxin component YwqK of YwqJK toxin-antitoxin module
MNRPVSSCRFACPAAALLGALLLSPLAHAVQDCELGGQGVNPNNGNTTAGKTGLMRCKDRDTGQIVREQELQNGRFMGVVRFYQDGKLQKEYSENERGNRQGRAREFSPTGQVLREGSYDNGDETGLSRTWYPDGQLRRATFYAPPNGELASAEFTEKGQLNSLHCADKPLLAPAADDARWCGFTGAPSRVEFFGSRGVLNARSSYVNGKRVRYESFNDNGNPSSQDEQADGRRVQRYFSTSGVKVREIQSAGDGKSWMREREQNFSDKGSLVRDQRWSGGKPVTDQTFYLNGQPKSLTEFGGESTTSRDGRAWQQVTQYYDSGKIASTGRYTADRRQTPTGTHQAFNEAGRVVSEQVYDERGNISREKTWDDNGQLLRDDAVFEDGSRKAFAR